MFEVNYVRVFIGGPFDGARTATSDRQPKIVVLDSEEVSHVYALAETRCPNTNTIEYVFRYDPKGGQQP